MAVLTTLPKDRARELRAEGLTLAAIGETLTAEGILPPKGGRWHETSVRRLLAEVSDVEVTMAALQAMMDGQTSEAFQALVLRTIEQSKAARLTGSVAIAIPRGYLPPGLRPADGTITSVLWSISGCRTNDPVEAPILGSYLGEVVVEMPAGVSWEVPR